MSNQITDMPPIEQDQPGFSLSDLEPFEPEPFIEEITDSEPESFHFDHGGETHE